MGKTRREKTLEKTTRKLERKNRIVVDWLISSGADEKTLKTAHFDEVLEAAYRATGMAFEKKYRTVNGYHSMYSAVLAHIGKRLDPGILTKKEEARFGRSTNQKASAFYQSYDWRVARYDALKANDGRCQLCGRDRTHGIILHVDHIKPLKKYWHLRLDPTNLQVLCNECNHGKGNRDETDWRSE